MKSYLVVAPQMKRTMESVRQDLLTVWAEHAPIKS